MSRERLSNSSLYPGTSWRRVSFEDKGVLGFYTEEAVKPRLISDFSLARFNADVVLKAGMCGPRHAAGSFVVTVDSSSLRASQEHGWGTGPVNQREAGKRTGRERESGRSQRQADRRRRAGRPHHPGQRRERRARAGRLGARTSRHQPGVAAQCCCKWKRMQRARATRRACAYSCSDFFKQCFSNQFWLGLTNNKKYDTGVLKQPWSPWAGLALLLSILRPMGYGSESETHRGVLEERLTVPVAHRHLTEIWSFFSLL